ncbi:troponin C [Halocaridina rubra]|uniref:Troponin C n=1 Tax=Halocaridina rubra TaxID=373956 RepID=A0AAN8WUE2_HALRR
MSKCFYTLRKTRTVSATLTNQRNNYQRNLKEISVETLKKGLNSSLSFSLHKTSAGLRKAFDAFDIEKKGSITVTTIATILRMMGVKVTEKNLQEIVAEVDEDGSGELEFEEFCALAAKFLIEEDEESLKAELKEAFRIYDKQGDGYITTQVLREILKELDNKLTEEDLDGIIEEVDEDGSGTLDFDEFMSMMAG